MEEIHDNEVGGSQLRVAQLRTSDKAPNIACGAFQTDKCRYGAYCKFRHVKICPRFSKMSYCDNTNCPWVHMNTRSNSNMKRRFESNSNHQENHRNKRPNYVQTPNRPVYDTRNQDPNDTRNRNQTPNRPVYDTRNRNQDPNRESYAPSYVRADEPYNYESYRRRPVDENNIGGYTEEQIKGLIYSIDNADPYDPAAPEFTTLHRPPIANSGQPPVAAAGHHFPT